MKKTKKMSGPYNPHEKIMIYARGLMTKCIEIEDSQRCFNLTRFLDSLASHLEGNSDLLKNDTFGLDSWHVARYIWLCIANESGDSPSGTKPGFTFRGMPILD